MAYSGSFQHNPDGALQQDTDRSEPADLPLALRPEAKHMPFDLGSLFQKTEVAGMETDDLLMALVLFLMYRESGDIDLLIMLGVMLLT